MRKFYLFSATVMVFAALAFFTSCKKEISGPAKIYAKAIPGSFIPDDGDIQLKDAPLVGGHQVNVYDKKIGDTNWTVVDGSEFLPGSAPALDWAPYVIDGAPWWFSGGVYITYCPVLPLRVVIKATVGGHGTAVSYLGIKDVTPSASSFPITVKDRRLGDRLTLNADALIALPGYTSLSFTMSYDKNIIDINQTALTSPVTDTNWPAYVYSGVTHVVDQLISGAGNVVVYDGLDSKITGTITIKIHVDSTVITKTVPASDLGHGMSITLQTTKVGWYDSGTIAITENDITPTVVNVSV